MFLTTVMPSLKVVSYNTKGFKFRNINYLNSIFKRCDVMMLQETWLYNFESLFISDSLKGSQCHCISAMSDDDVGRQGRPFGGLAIIWHSNSSVLVQSILVTSKRLCAVTLDFDNDNLILINVYMPIDDGSTHSFEEMGDILSEIESIAKLYSDRQILVCGDFNVDFSRNSVNLNLLKNFMKAESLASCYHIFNDDSFTYISPSGNKSYIDHILLKSEDVDIILNHKIWIEGENLSDHNPVFLEVKINSSDLLQKNKTETKSMINFVGVNWSKASNEDINYYKFVLDQLLLGIDHSSILCIDKNYDSVDEKVISNYIEQINECMILASKIAIPVSKYFSPREMPGWTEFVSPFRDDSMYWCRLWKDVGCPSYGFHYENMKEAKKQYHSAIRFIKNEKDTILKSKVANTLISNEFTEFWKVIKRNKRKKNIIPQVMDGVKGMKNIIELFHDKYKKLYNSYDDKENTIKLLNCVETKIRKMCCEGLCEYNHDINIIQIKNNVNKLKSKKNDPIYGIKSENVINGSDTLFMCLSILFNIFVNKGITDFKFNSSILVPLVKDNSKSASISSNYRAISLNPILNKLFEYVLMEILQNLKIKTDSAQFGFKSNVSTTMCSFAVRETIDYYKSNDSNVYAAFLDASKAFDLIKHSKMFECLLNTNLCPSILRIIAMMYLVGNCRVQWNNDKSRSFDLKNGVKQGGVLSPFLFSIYINPLIKMMHNSRKGCYIGKTPANIFIYADDIVLLSPTVTSMKYMIELCEIYSYEYFLRFNGEKSKVIPFTKYEVNNFVNICLNGNKLEIVNSYRHLGNVFINNRHLVDFKDAIHDMKVKCNTIINEFRNVDTCAKTKLFNSQCISLYGSVLIDIDNNNDIERLKIEWRKCCRYILNLNKRTRSILLPFLMQTPNVLEIIYVRFLNFFIKGLNHEDEFIRSFFYNSITSQNSYCVLNINKIISSLDMKYYELFEGKRIKSKNRLIDDCWKINVINELIHMRDFRLYNFFNRNEILTLLDDICTSS